MAFYYHSNYYQNQPPTHGEDVDFSYYSSYSNSDNKFLESQFFGYDLHHRPYDIENGRSYSSPSADSRFFGRYGYEEREPPLYYHQDAVVSHCAYSPVQQPTIAYSASPYYESKSFEIDPYQGDPYATRFLISCSTAGYNEPNFEEYDPTPYGGGYDPASTYGKPLPPSDEICYPIDSPGVIAIPADGGKTTDREEEQPTSEQKPLVPASEVKSKGDDGDGVYDDRPQEGSLHGNSKIMFPQAPPGLGLDALDICESLLGYWPCLARDARRGYSYPQEYNYGIQRNEWEGAADYLFGNPDPYSYSGSSGGRYDQEIGELISSSSSSYPYVQERPYDQDVEYERSGMIVFHESTR